jgi:phage anti-repressor protein
MAGNNAEMTKNEKKIQLIEMFIKTEKKLPAHIKTPLR